MQRQQDELEGFPKSTLVWLGVRHRGRVCFKENAEESALFFFFCFFVATLVHLTVCICLCPCLCSIPTLIQYPSTPICVIFRSQNGEQPTCLPTLHLLIWISRAQTIFCHYLYTLRIPRALLSSVGLRG